MNKTSAKGKYTYIRLNSRDENFFHYDKHGGYIIVSDKGRVFNLDYYKSGRIKEDRSNYPTNRIKVKFGERTSDKARLDLSVIGVQKNIFKGENTNIIAIPRNGLDWDFRLENLLLIPRNKVGHYMKKLRARYNLSYGFNRAIWVYDIKRKRAYQFPSIKQASKLLGISADKLRKCEKARDNSEGFLIKGLYEPIKKGKNPLFQYYNGL